MRTKNSSNIIDQTLKALFSQTFDNFNLFIVDSGSVDDTLIKCSKYPHTLFKVKAQDYHPGKVINTVLKKCVTDIVVFLNSDCVMLHPFTLQILLDSFLDNNIDAVYARQICRPEAFSWVQRDYLVSFPKQKKPLWMHFSLPLAAIKKKVWEDVPFYTQAWASEDTKWAIEIKQKGYSVKYEQNALVMHSHNYTFKQLFNRKYVEGEADAYIFEEKLTLFKSIRNFIGSVYRDFIFHLKQKRLSEFFNCILIRVVYHASHYWGYKNAMKRKNANNKNITFGDYQ